MVLSLVLTVILFICVAMLVREGLWSNVLTFFNAVFAGLVATSLWEPVADWLQDMAPSGRFLWDFIAIWAIFGIAGAIFRAVTDLASRYQVRFKKPVEWGGGVFFALCVGWIMVCFMSMTLHLAPLAEHHMRGAFYDQPDDRVFWGIVAPDRQWLGLVQQVSSGSLSASTGGGSVNTFDPKGQFIPTYAKQRRDYSTTKGILVE